MNHQIDLLMDSSILYRSTQKYFDKMLQRFSLTYGQLPILIMIYENEGISSQSIVREGAYDKGTVTKNVQKLQSLGYIYVLSSKKDKRAKELYTTDHTKDIMPTIYRIRRDWWKHIIKDLPTDSIEVFAKFYQKIAISARDYAEHDDHEIHFFKQQKLSLDSYPNKLSMLLSTGGCNFRCANCLSKDLVFLKENVDEISLLEIKEELKEKKRYLDAVCIDGGEPLIHPELESFLMYLKECGYLVKIQTNGTHFDYLVHLIQKNLIDCVGINLKNSPEKYGQTIGMKDFVTDDLNKSIAYLLTNDIYTIFSITLSKELHTLSDMYLCAQWIHGAKEMVLDFTQDTFKWSQSEIDTYVNAFKPYIENVRVKK